MTRKILKADALRPKFIRLYSGNGAYGVYIVFADQSDVPLYEGPSAVKAIHFAGSAAESGSRPCADTVRAAYRLI